MLPYFREVPGNAASRSHAFGWEAGQAVATARERLAGLLHVEADELTFTSGATEAINLALKGVAYRYIGKGRHLVTIETEHPAVLDTCGYLETQGFEVSYLGVDESGLVDPDALRASLRPDTTLCAVMWANNETGVIQDMSAIGTICREAGTLLFSDATQAAGKISVDPRAVGVSVLACSGHKFYGPKGVGALWVSGRAPRVRLTEQQHGGGHEGGHRSGTLNVPGIVGMGAAAVLAQAEMKAVGERLRGWRDRLEAVLASVPAVRINGAAAPRLPHISNLTLRFTEAEALLSTFQRRLALSTGSACASADLEPSHVLLAMGLDREDAKASVRLSLGRETTVEHLELASELLVRGVEKLRAESPIWELFLDGAL